MSGAKVLIIDDNKDFAEGLAEFLDLYGHEVDVAVTGESGLEAAQRSRYDAVFVDIGLPGMNGIECAQQINRIGPAPRCFLMTGYSREHIAGRAGQPDALEVLTKPLDMDDVLRRIADSLPGR